MESNCLLPENIRADWRFWCRLCAKEDLVGSINILFKDDQQPDEMDTMKLKLRLDVAIKNFFRINITQEDALPKMICTDCFSLVTSLVNFSERVIKVQNMFAALQDKIECTENSLHDTRLKFGILDADREHLISQTLPEVLFFESPQLINELGEHLFEAETTNSVGEQHINIRIKKEKSPDILINNDKSGEGDPFLSDRDEDYVCSPTDNYNSSSEEATIAEAKHIESNVGASHERKFKMLKLATNDKTNFDDESAQKKAIRKRSTRIFSLDDNTVQSEDKKKSKIGDSQRRLNGLKQLKDHLNSTQIKTTEKKCTQCASTFRTDYQLKIHTKKHLSLAEKKLVPCTYCGKKLSSQWSVQQHIRHIHMNERPFVCEECGVAKHTTTALKEHMLAHTDYAPFECEVCKKCFKTHKALNNHLETHSSTKHTCPQCGLQLKTRLMLSRHMVVHSDKMDHICDYCGRGFKRSKNLKLHRFLHTGMPFSCDFCDRTFVNRNFCQKHRMKSHPAELKALEATETDNGKSVSRNIPELQTFKALVKTTDTTSLSNK